jgi:hypothetical protein
MTALFNDTEKQILELFAHTKVEDSQAYNPEYRIDADRVQIETLTGLKFDANGELRTNHLQFNDNGMSVSFFRLFLECFDMCKCGDKNCTNEI